MQKLLIVLLSSLVISGSVNAQTSDFNINEIYPIESSHSYVGFSIKYMGYAMVRGRFAEFGGTVRYNEKDILKTSVSFSVNVASIDTDLDWRDNDLKSDNWFDAEQFPKMFFTSKRVEKKGLELNVIGDLTIKGVTKEITMIMDQPSGVLKDIRGDSQVIFTGKVVLNRTEFGVEGKNWSRVKEGITAVDNMVNIEVSILGKQINEGNFRNWVRNVNRPPGKVYSMINENGVESAMKEFETMLAVPDSKLNSGALNIAGYMLMKEGKIDEAIKVFEQNIKSFPGESNVYDSYAEALMVKGDLAGAKENYKKSLEIDPDNQNAKEVMRHLK